jgi:hypothetical protein
MTEEPPEIPLAGGSNSAAARRGAQVLRKTGPWTPAVHSLLRHLEDVGFTGAPRLVGTGFSSDGRELLGYIEGEIVHPGAYADDAIADLGRLMRNLHEATRSFRPPEGAVWQKWFGREIGTPNIIGHCDAAPWNILCRNGKPVALIDWEASGPVDRLTEIALVAWNGAQLYDDDVAELNGLADARTRINQVRILSDAYGLSASDRHRLTDRMIDLAAQSAAYEVVEQNITPETVQPACVWGIAWRTRSVAWMLRHRSALENALK